MAKTFWRLRKASFDLAASEVMKTMPEVPLDREYVIDSLKNVKLQFYYREQATTPVWIRLTLPIAFIVTMVLFLLTPVNYIITGRWGYKIVWLKNWLSALGF